MENRRTLKQNAAMYKFFDLISKEATATGITFSEFLAERPRLNMHWTPTRVKELWKEIQYLLYRTTSTADLTKPQIDKVYEVFNQAVGEVMNIHVPFPSEETRYGDTTQS